MAKQHFSDKEFNAAQKKLNGLCKQHGIMPWNIQTSQGNWKELVWALCGLGANESEKRKPGAPEIYTHAKKKELVEAVESLRFGNKDMQLNQDFGQYDENGKKIKPKMTRKRAFEKVISDNGIIPRKRESRGTENSPHNVIRKIYTTAQKELHKEEERCRQELSALRSSDD